MDWQNLPTKSAGDITASHTFLVADESQVPTLGPDAFGKITRASLGTLLRLPTDSITWDTPGPFDQEIPDYCHTVEILAYAGGGGGGSGRRDSAAAHRYGGGGGGGGALVHLIFPRSYFGATISGSIGAGGAGGASITTDTTVGAIGTAGGDTVVGPLTAKGGNPGAGGNASPMTGGGAVNTSCITPTIASAISSKAGGTSDLTGGTGSQSGLFPSGGGGGGTLSSTDVAAKGGSCGGYFISVNIGAAFEPGVGSVGGQTAGASASVAVPSALTLAGVGGGGGAANNAGPGGDGADGAGYGGGGGGGGSCINGNASGKGGKGSDGAVVFKFY